MTASSTFGEERPFQGIVVRLACAAGEHDLVGAAAQQGSHLCPRLLDSFPCRTARPMRTGRVAEWFLQDLSYRRCHLGRDGSRAIEVEIDLLLVHGWHQD